MASFRAGVNMLVKFGPFTIVDIRPEIAQSDMKIEYNVLPVIK
jgi:hypothetical protein